jgi:glycosyltransferase involved in cell wall biosynthesis
MLRQEYGDAADRAHVVHPCVDDIFVPAGKGGVPGDVLARWGLEEPPFLFVGRGEPKKGLPVLLRALALLRERGSLRRKLLLVGPAGWGGRAVHRVEAELDPQAHVVRAGYVPRAELPAIYRSALALAFPSLVEGFGLPPLEAMACGTPVVATHAGGLRESVGDAALTVPPGDAEALADALAQMEDSADLRGRLRAAGLQRAQRFRWPQAATRMVGLYEAASEAGRAR